MPTKRTAKVDALSGLQACLLLTFGLCSAPASAFEPPEAPPVEYYQNIWKQSPFDRQVLPDKPVDKPVDYAIQSTWRIGPDRYISIVSRLDKSTLVVSSNPDKSDNGGKLLSFQEADKIDDVSAKVEVNGQQVDVKFDRQLVAMAAPKVQAPAPAQTQANNNKPATRRVVIPNRNTQTPSKPVVRRTQSRGIVLPGQN